MENLINIDNIYDSLKNDLKEQVKKSKALTLASVKIGKVFASDVYFASQQKFAREVGINYFSVELDSNVSQEEIVKKIKESRESLES